MSESNDQNIQSILQRSNSWQIIPERYDNGVGFDYGGDNLVEIVVEEQAEGLEGDYVVGVRPGFESIDLENPTGLDEMALEQFREILNETLEDKGVDSRMRPVNYPGKMRFYGYNGDAEEVVEALSALADSFSNYEGAEELLTEELVD